MKIAMVSEHASPLAVLGGVDAGGQNVHVAELSAALVRAGHQVTVYTRRDSVHVPRVVRMPSGVAVEHVVAGPPRPVPKDALLPFMGRFAESLRKALARDPVDVVHAHFWMSARAALAATQSTGTPVFVTFHALGSEKQRMQGANDPSPPERISEETRIARSVTRVLATSTSEISELALLGIETARARLVPCGVDADFFAKPAPLSALPRRCRYRIVTLSRLVARKGVDDAIAALASVPDAELLVGGGPCASELGIDAEAARLSQHALACGVADRVTLLGRVERAALPSLFRSADAVVCAPWYEPFGLVAVEAMASGLPVVATNVGGQRDTIVDGQTGLHVAPRRPQEIASALQRLLAADELRVRLGAEGRERAKRFYSWDRVASATVMVYREREHAVAGVEVIA